MEMKQLKAIGRNLIIRKIEQEQKIGMLHIPTDSLDENIIGVVMATPRYSYHPNGDINPDPDVKVGDTVALMRGKVGTTLPAAHIPSEYSSDNKNLWLAVTEEFILYKVEA